ncbi:MAG: tetratricopeptide repeat protein [Desulfatiglandaceae bacterium]
MDLLAGVNTDNLFITAYQQQQSLENLTNNALRAGMDAYQKEDYETAAKAFKRAVNLAPQSPLAGDASNYLAMSHLKLEDSEKAIEAYQRWMQLKPDQADPHVKLGNLYFSLGRHKDAQDEYAEAVRLDPTAENRYALGQAYLFQDQYTDAEAEFQKVQRLYPLDPAGYYGLGLAYSKQGRHEKAVELFDEALKLDREFFDAYAEKGYAYADMGDMEAAEKIVEFLKDEKPELSNTLSQYMYKADPPKIEFAAMFDSTFNYQSSRKTPVSNLDSYLENANAEKTFKMVFVFGKEMDRSSVENPLNWMIQRTWMDGAGTSYNYGLPIPDTEVKIPTFPDHVHYEPDSLSATVYFTIKQNASADGTIDPSHIEFKFSGKDKWDLSMDKSADQFTGFSKVF